MVEVKATTDEATNNIGREVNINANGIEYIAEVVSIIESLMKGLKRDDKILHAMVLKVIADNPNILFGEDEDDDKDYEAEMSRLMSKAIIREGVN